MCVQWSLEKWPGSEKECKDVYERSMFMEKLGKCILRYLGPFHNGIFYLEMAVLFVYSGTQKSKAMSIQHFHSKTHDRCCIFM